jgi:hypothetical protein
MVTSGPFAVTPPGEFATAGEELKATTGQNKRSEKNLSQEPLVGSKLLSLRCVIVYAKS